MMSDDSGTTNRDKRDLPAIGDPHSTCPGKMEVPTEKEQEV